MKKICAHLAVVRSVSSRHSTDNVVLAGETSDSKFSDTSISPCGKYFVWGKDCVFLSDIMMVELEVKEDFEYEIEACNKAIDRIRSECFDKMEKELEVPKARKLELQQLVHMPIKDEIAKDIYGVPSADGLDECEDAYQESIAATISDVVDNDDGTVDVIFETEDVLCVNNGVHFADHGNVDKPIDDHLFDDGPYNGLVDDEDGT